MGTSLAGGGLQSSPSAGQTYYRSFALLAEYYQTRTLTEDELTSAELKFAEAFARCRFDPPEGALIADRVHVMVFGGAGAGKSTVSNVVLGSELAEVNPQAGYTRHPTAFCRFDKAEDSWPRKIGSLTRSDTVSHSDLDDDRFDWWNIADAIDETAFFDRFVLWDCPDLTTKDAEYYQGRVIEIAALAEITIYVASDERYNDELPTNFLQAMLLAGKHVIVALTKMAQADAERLAELFEAQVASRLLRRERIAKVIPVPSPSSGSTSELWSSQSGLTPRFRQAIEEIVASVRGCKEEARRLAVEYFRTQHPRLLDPVRRDLAEWSVWTELVRKAANEAVLRHERSYLASVEIPQFIEARNRLVQELNFATGPLQYLSTFFEVLRLPARWLADRWRRSLPMTDPSVLSEDQSLDRIRKDLLDSLRAAAATKRDRHRLWTNLADDLETESRVHIEPAYQKTRDQQRRLFAERLDESTRLLLKPIVNQPSFATLLRGGRLAVDVLVVVALFASFGFSLSALILLPIVLGGVDLIVQALAGAYLSRFKNSLVDRQKEDVRELVQRIYIDKLLSMPRPLGAQLTRMQEIVARLPIELDHVAKELGV